MYSPCDENSYEKTAYNDYSLVRDLPTIIVNYLFNNSPDFWKLLKYSQNPLDKTDLTNEEKAKMIAKTSFNTEEYNVLFQKYTVDAVVKAKSQVRVFVDNISSYGRTNALATIIFQVFDQLCDGEYTSYNFCYYARIDGKVYCFDGYWDETGKFNYSRNLEKVRG